MKVPTYFMRKYTYQIVSIEVPIFTLKVKIIIINS